MIERPPHHPGFLACGNDDDGKLRMQGAQMHQRIEAVRARHVEVHQQEIGIGMRLDQRVERIDAVGFMQPHPRHHPLHRPAQGLAEQGVVVGDQQGSH